MIDLERKLQSLKNGDTSALAEIYEQTKRGVFMTAYSILRDKSRAEDIMQESYLRLKGGIHTYQNGTNGKAWINSIARNLALKEFNRQKPLESLEDKEYLVFGKSGDRVAENDMLQTAFKILNTDERQIVILHAVEGFKNKEIAKIMKKPLGTVLWVYNKAIKKLQKALKEDG